MRPTADQLNQRLREGGYVQVTTYTKSTLYGPKWVGACTEQFRANCIYALVAPASWGALLDHEEPRWGCEMVETELPDEEVSSET